MLLRGGGGGGGFLNGRSSARSSRGSSRPALVWSAPQPGRRGLPCRALGGEEAEEPEEPASARQREILRHLSRQTVSGSERGEAFFTLSHSSPNLDVDTLNDKMRATGAARLRNVQSPDQAYGLIFNLDHLVVNTREAMGKAWSLLAKSRDLPCPEDTQRLVLHGTCPERVMMDVLGWSRDTKAVRGLCLELADAYSEVLHLQTLPAAPGIREWLECASTYGMPCAAVSTLDRATARRLLERMHLHDHLDRLVAAEDESMTQAQSFLSAALQLQRPPNHCVVFDDCPLSITAAHNASMKIVGIRSKSQPGYRLRGADVTVSSFGEIQIYNIRRLFANQGHEMGDLRTEQSGQRSTTRRIRNATM